MKARGPGISRRRFLRSASVVCAAAISPRPSWGRTAKAEIIDIHQHCGFSGRTDEELMLHQRNTGAGTTVVMPSALPGSNEHVIRFARAHADHYAHFACADLGRPAPRRTIEPYLKTGAIGIGELKDRVACDCPGMEEVAALARDYAVPILIHFEDRNFNDGYERFYRILEKFPTVTFIGHATTFWGRIDKGYRVSRGPYPRGPVAPGGLTDLWLSDYPNFYGDLSSNSGNGGLARDPVFAAGFLARHQDKLLYGSDCACRTGTGPTCISVVKLGLLRQMASSKEILDKLLFGNARKLYRFSPAQLA